MGASFPTARFLSLAVVAAITVIAGPLPTSTSRSIPRDQASSRSTIQILAIDVEVDKSPVLNRDFADPSIVQDTDGTWYAFATASGNKQVQVATASDPSGPWTYLAGVEALPNSGNWTTGYSNWAPDVRVLGQGRYVMYYSGQTDNAPSKHCVGTASATSIKGPYTPASSAWACPEAQGGAIDPAGFYDESTGRRWVVYKIDGNSVGNGGDCNNGVAPYAATPLMLQEVDAGDGVTKVGNATQILDRTQDEDGPLVEAPSLIRARDGTYVLFYSSHCWSSPNYNINYATAQAVTGPYTRGDNPLIETGDYNTTSPGGATSVPGGESMVFHANCPNGIGRCMFEADFVMKGREVILSQRKSGRR